MQSGVRTSAPQMVFVLGPELPVRAAQLRLRNQEPEKDEERGGRISSLGKKESGRTSPTDLEEPDPQTFCPSREPTACSSASGSSPKG